MVDIYAVPVFHHGGYFGRGPSGTLEYIGGKIEKFPEMDLDFVNFGDLVTLFKGLGYATYREVYWYDPTSNNIESGLHILRGDAGINEMRENKLRNATTNEFYIYFDHAVDEPQIVEEDAAAEQGAEEFDDSVDVQEIMRELQSSPSTEGDGNGSEEDELYKPPPNVTGTSSDDEFSSLDEENDGMKKRRSVKGKEKVLPKRKVTVKEGPGAEPSGSKRRGGPSAASGPDGKGTMPTAKPKGTGPSGKPKGSSPKLAEPTAGEASGSAPVAAPFMGQPSAPRQTPFRPPSKLLRVEQPISNAAAPDFRPKQPIVRPPTISNPAPNPPPHTQQTQSKSTRRGPSKETLKAASSTTKRILKPQKK